MARAEIPLELKAVESHKHWKFPLPNKRPRASGLSLSHAHASISICRDLIDNQSAYEAFRANDGDNVV